MNLSSVNSSNHLLRHFWRWLKRSNTSIRGASSRYSIPYCCSNMNLVYDIWTTGLSHSAQRRLLVDLYTDR